MSLATPPSSVESQPTTVYTASTWARIGASMIDSVLTSIIGGILVAITWPKSPTQTVPWTPVLAALLGIGFYNVIFLVLKGATPGKSFLGLRVILSSNASEKKIPILPAIIRGTSSLLGNLGFYYLFGAVAFLNLERRTIPDYLAGTRVVQILPLKNEKKKRFVVAILLFLFSISILISLWGVAKQTTFSREGIYIPLPDLNSLQTSGLPGDRSIAQQVQPAPPVTPPTGQAAAPTATPGTMAPPPAPAGIAPPPGTMPPTTPGMAPPPAMPPAPPTGTAPPPVVPGQLAPTSAGAPPAPAGAAPGIPGRPVQIMIPSPPAGTAPPMPAGQPAPQQAPGQATLPPGKVPPMPVQKH